MLLELRVTDLGIIEELHLLIGPGLTAITGETGAGKTLITGAIALLAGERADAGIVRDGASEARVEGRFENDAGDEVVLARVVPAIGRSRAYIDGRLASAAELAFRAVELLDLHAQHAHQALLEPVAQRRILDAFAGESAAVAFERFRAARVTLTELDAALSDLGGDTRMRAREISLLEFQVGELDAAGLDDPLEDATLDDEEQQLSDAQGLRDALHSARGAIDDTVADGIGAGVAAMGGRAPLAGAEERLRALQVDAADLAHDLREQFEAIVDDPARLEVVRARRQLFRELGRKYGANLADVIAFRNDANTRLVALRSHDERVEQLELARAGALTAVDAAAAGLRAERRAAAGPVAAAVNAPERCWRCGLRLRLLGPCPVAERWSSTRWTPESAVRRGRRWAEPWPNSPRTPKYCASPTWRRSRHVPTRRLSCARVMSAGARSRPPWWRKGKTG